MRILEIAGVVLVFDSIDGGQIAATRASLEQIGEEYCSCEWSWLFGSSNRWIRRMLFWIRPNRSPAGRERKTKNPMPHGGRETTRCGRAIRADFVLLIIVNFGDHVNVPDIA